MWERNLVSSNFLENYVLLFFWLASLCDLESLTLSDRNTRISTHPSFLVSNPHRTAFDDVVVNTGHHWRRWEIEANRWDTYVDGKPFTDQKLAPVKFVKNLTMHSTARWLDSRLLLHPVFKAFLTTMAPRHIKNGDGKTRASCDSVAPLMQGGSEVGEEPPRNTEAASAVNGTKYQAPGHYSHLSEMRADTHLAPRSSTGSNDWLPAFLTTGSSRRLERNPLCTNLSFHLPLLCSFMISLLSHLFYSVASPILMYMIHIFLF